MVENFTPTEEETYINDVENITTIEDTFEGKNKRGSQKNWYTTKSIRD
ncbi:hypothetical protein [Sphingobacterium sp. T2]|nr:hypothetical protein [Sphingobacterium sp. T2]